MVDAGQLTAHAREGNFFSSVYGSSYNFGTLDPGESAIALLVDIPRRAGTSAGAVICTATATVRVTADQPDSLPGNNSNQSFVLYYSCDVLCSLEALFCEVQNVRSPIASGRAEGPSVLRWPAALQEEAIDLLVYHFVRDRVLAGTEDGQRYVDLYYAHDAEIQTLLDADDALKAEATATLKLWEPHLWALVLGDGDEATITTAQVAAVDAFLANLSAAAGPALQAAIAAERDRLPPPDTFVGLTMAEARGLTVGYGRYLPLALRE